MIPLWEGGCEQWTGPESAYTPQKCLVLDRRFGCAAQFSPHLEGHQELLLRLGSPRQALIDTAIAWLKERLMHDRGMGAIVRPNRQGGEQLGVLMGTFCILIPVQEEDSFEAAEERIECYGPKEQVQFFEQLALRLDRMLDDPVGVLIELVPTPTGDVLH